MLLTWIEEPWSQSRCDSNDLERGGEKDEEKGYEFGREQEGAMILQ